jgi:hypothetical protein
MTLHIIPIELKDANALIAQWHRHHKPVQGHRFSIGVSDNNGVIHGACVVGRPVARLIDHHTTLEVTRLVTDGTPNACSILYAAAARAGKELGYLKIQTYILEGESGISLLAAGWSCDDPHTGGGQWRHHEGKPRRTDQPTCFKQRWSKSLNPKPVIEKS